MATLKVGFNRVDVTPMLGVKISGYYKERIADGVLDNLEVSTVAYECGDKKAVMLSVPHCGLKREIIAEVAAEITKATGLSKEQILIHATHTHTGPWVRPENMSDLETTYKAILTRKLADSARMALADLSPAKMGFGTDTLRLPLTSMTESKREAMFELMRKQGIEI